MLMLFSMVGGGLLTVILFIILLSVLVLIHEFGHFIVAKRLGIKVEEFGFGFPPRAIGKKWGETIYSINWLPFGGFVKLYGEDEAGAGRITLSSKNTIKAKDSDRAFYSRPTWQKASVVIAGVIMNYLLALGIFSYLAAAQGVIQAGNVITVAQVEKNSPADTAGIKPSDKIIAIDGEKISSADMLISLVKQHAGSPVKVSVETVNRQLNTVTLIPRTKVSKNQGAMGVALTSNAKLVKYSGFGAIKEGFVQTGTLTVLTLSGLKTAVGQALNKQFPQGVAGPFGIVRLTGVAEQYGFYAVLSLVGILSLTLALFNIFPIPALDGGRLFFILLDGIAYLLFKKNISPRIEAVINPIAFALLIALIILITFHDIYSWATGQPLIPQ